MRIVDLVPTQSKIFADELEGRKYELEKGLAEPLIVIQKRNKILLVDGHHRQSQLSAKTERGRRLHHYDGSRRFLV